MYGCCQANPKARLQLAAGTLQGFKLDPRFNKDLKAETPKRAMGQEMMRPACQQIKRSARAIKASFEP
ncbi:Hypothetical protein P9303_19261 [Prochlorococcus marinus str. MIT 9303]|uniref:Uncharacterized protein n=1 Tax=Prochlorococcus marinus (strain MIT 9303) TaxID=59922 RepID=A2CB08_PROM3|nr:Hypothetical protein P9303_19261 [Prochlorococcus marinus str. MIT 9303]